MMYRLGERFIKARKMLCLINGESIGQVASQTLQSMKAVEAVTSFPVIRPLATMDKHVIIDVARQIDTFAISTRPYEDCCSIYVPRSPATKPMHIYALKYEALFDYEPMLDQALAAIWTLDITPKTRLDVCRFGLTTKEARIALKETER
jgi:thiamine biosynthesis protein ThiI